MKSCAEYLPCLMRRSKGVSQLSRIIQESEYEIERSTTNTHRSTSCSANARTGARTCRTQVRLTAAKRNCGQKKFTRENALARLVQVTCVCFVESSEKLLIARADTHCDENHGWKVPSSSRAGLSVQAWRSFLPVRKYVHGSLSGGPRDRSRSEPIRVALLAPNVLSDRRGQVS